MGKDTDGKTDAAQKNPVGRSIEWYMGLPSVVKILIPAGAGGFLFLVLCCGCGSLFFFRGDDEPTARDFTSSEEQLRKADQLWASGEKADAVDFYTSLMYGREGTMFLHRYNSGDVPRIYRRVIEYRMEVGGPEAARDDIRDAIKKHIPITASTQEGNAYIAQVRAEYEEEQRAALEQLAMEEWIRTNQMGDEINRQPNGHWTPTPEQARQFEEWKNSPASDETIRQLNELLRQNQQ